ncbi:hypothetical protein DFQ26_009928 [Actinomortierella ambigua]|nr:hypothetical protein DFQ26_009928 [Actinomortierella ambigua]
MASSARRYIANSWDPSKVAALFKMIEPYPKRMPKWLKTGLQGMGYFVRGRPMVTHRKKRREPVSETPDGVPVSVVDTLHALFGYIYVTQGLDHVARTYLTLRTLAPTALNWQSSSSTATTTTTVTKGNSIEFERQAWLSEAVARLLLVESWGQYLPEGVDSVGRHENPCKDAYWETICMGLTDMLDLRDMGDEAQSYFETLPAFNRHVGGVLCFTPVYRLTPVK